jgi:WD40-like Beta Propeller Repeat
MKRFGAVCVLAFLAIFLIAGCNDYGNTFQGNTGARLTAISPAIVGACGTGCSDLTITLFGGPFVAQTVAQWNGKNLATTPTLDANSNVINLKAVVPKALIANPGKADINTLSPHSGSQDNGLSNTLAFIINPPPNPLPVLATISPAAANPGSAPVTLTITGTSFIPSSDPTGGSTVNWNANGAQTALATSSVSATQIQATIPASLLTTQSCGLVSVFNPAAIPTVASSGVGNPFSGGGGTSFNTPGFAVSTDPAFIANCNAMGVHPATARTSAIAFAEETPALAQDGRYVAYTATQSGHTQIFVRDTCTGAPAGCQSQTTLLSAASDGTAGNADSNTPSASTDGRFVAFSSAATNLAASAPAGRQIYLRDTCAGAATECTPQTTLISTDESGLLSGNDNLLPSISSSGRFVAFLSVTSSQYAAKSAGNPNSGYRQVFVRDTCFGAATACTPATTRISLVPGDANSLQSKPAGPAISGSARAVGVSAAATPTLFTRTIPIDDRVFLALTNSAQK